MIYKHIKGTPQQSSKLESHRVLCTWLQNLHQKNKRMMQSELLHHTSWPTQSFFQSNLDHYVPNMGFYESEHHEFPSPINSTPDNSLITSDSYVPGLSDGYVEYPLLGYDQIDSQDIMALDDVCRWLCDDDQGIQEIQSEKSIEGDGIWSPALSMKSSDVELESETGLPNLLKAYADAMAMEQRELAKVIARCIGEKVNPIGPALERIAFNLFQHAENQGEEYLKQESMKNFKTAFRAFYDIFPYGRFAHFAANSAILEAIPSHAESIHIVDFDMGEGTQWPSVMEAIARQRKSLTITSVKLEDHDSGFEETKWHLSNYARSMGLDLNVENVELAELVKVVERPKFGREFLAFNCMIGFPHMGGPRTQATLASFLKLAKGLLAKTEGIITFGDGEDGERIENCSNYTSFFDGNLAHYKALYESLEWGFPSYLTEARIAIETLFVAPYVSSLSWFQKWEEGREEVVVSRKDIGLKGRSMSTESLNEARELVKEEESPYGIRIEGDNGNEMVLEWRGTPLVRVSAWVGGFKYKPPFGCEREDNPERDTWQSETAGQVIFNLNKTACLVQHDSSDCHTLVDGDERDHILADGDHRLADVSEEFELRSEVVEFDDGTMGWIPIVPDGVKPFVNMKFANYSDAEEMYRQYADFGGFDVRLNTRKINNVGLIQNRWLVCSKQGNPRDKSFNSLIGGPRDRQRRNSNVKRMGCKACVKFRLNKEKDGYEIYELVEVHNHVLFDSNDRRYSKRNRKMKYTDFRNILSSSTYKLGATKTFRLQTALKGGFEYMKGTASDYQNFKREVGLVVGRKDAKMLINKLTRRKEVKSEYFFEYACKAGELQAVFWADEIAQRNYIEFGDVISFDATYRSNQHAMAFVPFLAVDNHKASVVIGSALIAGETIENFTWVLQAFLKCYKKQPAVVLTDQCSAMKQAVPLVFNESRHRLCMWHIMKKVPSKVSVALAHDPDFNNAIKKLVWNLHISPEEFEEKWECMIQQYGLVGDPWFTEMFEIRHSWIPAYFKDLPMSGLMKTTSRSESANAFFNMYVEFNLDLCDFLNNYDGAIERQREDQSVHENSTRVSLPRLVSPLLLEVHAAKLYTRNVFWDVQKELKKAMWYCGIDSVQDLDGSKVVFEVDSHTVDCSCNFFTRNGFLCRHCFKVLINENVEFIPDRYVMRRWMRGLVPAQIVSAKVRYGEVDTEKEALFVKVYSVVDDIVTSVRNDIEEFKGFYELLCGHKRKVSKILPGDDLLQQKLDAIREHYGVAVPDDPDFFPPTGLRNKGAGTGKRLESNSEKIQKRSKKQKRKCKTCGIANGHDSQFFDIMFNEVFFRCITFFSKLGSTFTPTPEFFWLFSGVEFFSGAYPRPPMWLFARSLMRSNGFVHLFNAFGVSSRVIPGAVVDSTAFGDDLVRRPCGASSNVSFVWLCQLRMHNHICLFVDLNDYRRCLHLQIPGRKDLQINRLAGEDDHNCEKLKLGFELVKKEKKRDDHNCEKLKLAFELVKKGFELVRN
ncbi:hypothetical protein OSB04_024943 [Centaurea solstitialis]|uniref:SWIM-type domain-containing protein n=1 Tax=Centaurea solstitialis TaxID=347529 RepID=A0AA38T0I3_9ASTR|nr:hypothetical protein OSB04_024943 [Centaurea solstitialis]